MGQGLIVFLLGILPAFLLVGYIYKLDSYQREPIRWILKGMGYGVGSIFLALLLDELILVFLPCSASVISLISYFSMVIILFS